MTWGCALVARDEGSGLRDSCDGDPLVFILRPVTSPSTGNWPDNKHLHRFLPTITTRTNTNSA